ncbi:MAG: glutamate synthase-related protein [Desulfatiglandaceae bacterium]
MPSKYVIPTRTVAHRFRPITRSGIVAWEEGCLKCAVCVKTECVYGVYDHRGLDPRQMVDAIDNECMNCLRCVQGCPGELIHKTVNPEYQSLGDAHWTPEVISKLWAQAQTGKIPVSGAGYPGPFTGPGFDAMWTDMSEIVRPTRDGIHGREYISTGIDVGKTLERLLFDGTGTFQSNDARFLNIPLPILLQVPAFGAVSEKTIRGWAAAAKRLGTLITIPSPMLDAIPEDLYPWVVPEVSGDAGQESVMAQGVRMVEIPWSEAGRKTMERVKNASSEVLISVGLPLEAGVEETALSLVREGACILHLMADAQGAYLDGTGRYLKEGIQAVHLKLVETGLRDQMTLLAGGGIAMAEHVPKSIICGADGVVVDFPLLIALECRMCRRCTRNLACPVEIPEAPSSWVASRVINLVGAWHNQLLEVMGAMGIRDARRLRGETGRAMFFEALDEEIFGSMNRVENGCELE